MISNRREHTNGNIANVVDLWKPRIMVHFDFGLSAIWILGAWMFKCLQYLLLKFENKKVLLRECKRHTARWVASTPSAVLSWEEGYPCSGMGWGCPLSWGTPPPDLDKGVSKSCSGGTASLAGRVPHPGIFPLGKGLGPETWERTWDWGTPLWTETHLWKYYFPASLWKCARQ